MLVISPAASADTPVHISGSDAGDDFLADCGDFDLRDSFTFEFEGTVFSDDDGNVTASSSTLAVPTRSTTP